MFHVKHLEVQYLVVSPGKQPIFRNVGFCIIMSDRSEDYRSEKPRAEESRKDLPKGHIYNKGRKNAKTARDPAVYARENAERTVTRHHAAAGGASGRSPPTGLCVPVTMLQWGHCRAGTRSRRERPHIGAGANCRKRTQKSLQIYIIKMYKNQKSGQHSKQLTRAPKIEILKKVLTNQPSCGIIVNVLSGKTCTPRSFSSNSDRINMLKLL